MNKVCTKYDPNIVIESMKILILGLKILVSALAGEENISHLGDRKIFFVLLTFILKALTRSYSTLIVFFDDQISFFVVF